MRTPASKILTIVIFTALGLWLTGLVFFTITTTVLTPDNPVEKADAAIVLTGGSNRVNTGLDLLKDDKVTQVFITGVDERVRPETLLSLWGQPDQQDLLCCITLEHEAQNTVENARKTKIWLDDFPQDIDSVYLVTSEYHIPRAWLEFTTRINDRTILIYPVESEKRSLKYWLLVIQEFHKTVLAGLWHIVTGIAKIL